MHDTPKGLLNDFHAIAGDPLAYARQWRKTHQKPVVGHLCSYVPREIIYAAGALPFRLFGAQADITAANAHLQAYSCQLIRGALQDALDGKLGFLNGLVFPHTCDAVQQLSDIWRLNTDFDFHLDLLLPVKLNTDSAKMYLRDVIADFRQSLQRVLGRTISDEDLQSAVTTANTLRRRLRAFYEIHRRKPEQLTADDLQAVLKCAMLMDPADCLARVDSLLSLFDRDTAATGGSAKQRIVLSGGLCHMPDVYQLIEDAGALIVYDDMCTGSRSLEGAIGTDVDPLTAIAHHCIERAVCPSKHSGLYARATHLRRRVSDYRAAGVIFLYLKFCDPHAFDIPHLTAMLAEAGVPSLVVALEDAIRMSGALRTRCEAFIEMLPANSP